MIGIILNTELIDRLNNEWLSPDIRFNLENEDNQGNKVLDIEQIQYCNIQWIKDLQTVEYLPKQINFNRI